MHGLVRASAEELDGGVRYTLPSRKNRYQTGFLSLWLVGWTAGELSAIWRLLTQSGDSFLKVWLLIWTIGGLSAIYHLMSLVIGKELVTVSATELTIQRDVSGWEKARGYSLPLIRNLRLATEPEDLFWSRSPGPFTNGMIAFDYELKTVRFGAGLDAREAGLIILDLQKRLASS